MEKPDVRGSSSTSDLFFYVHQRDNASDKVIVPRDLLDDEVGDKATIGQRKLWVEDNIEEIMRVYRAKRGGGTFNARFRRVQVEGIE